jgi:predicted small integral membrane protein
MHIVPIILGSIISLLLIIVGWSATRMHTRKRTGVVPEFQGDLMFWLLLLAAFGMGAFLVLVGTGF